MIKHITCVDLPIGAHYKFDFSDANNRSLSEDTYIRLDGYSKTTKGRHVEWSGHQNHTVIRVEGTVPPWHWHHRSPVVALSTSKPEVHSVTAVPEVSITRKRLTIDKIGVGQTFIIHGQPETVYVKISNSHVFNHKRLQMHTTVAERFKQHLNLVAVELVVYNGK